MATTSLQPPSSDVTATVADLESERLIGAGPPRRRRRRRRNGFAWALVAPAALFMTVFHILPALAGGYLSFLRLNTFTLPQLFGAPWAGLENYHAVLFDSSNPLHSGFVQAAKNTVIYTTTVVAGTIGGGMAIALLLNREFPGRRVVRTLMLTPWIVPSFVVAILWQFMWQRDDGIINKILVDYTGLLGHHITWLLGDNTIWAIVIPSIWRGLPLPMLFFLAGLQAVPRELHEAARMDGANAWRRF